MKQWRTQDLAKGEVQQGSGGELPSCQRIFVVFTQKTLILAHFFIENEHAVLQSHIENAKIFSQRLSKSRSLAKISRGSNRTGTYAENRFLLLNPNLTATFLI